MSSSGEFCPRCGKPVESREGPRVGDPHGRRAHLCDACYFEDFDLVDAPEELTVRICPRCGAVYRGNRWIDVGAEDYTDVAVEEVTEALSVHVDADEFTWLVDPEQVDQNTILMHCHFSGVVRETPVEADRDVRVRFSRETCTRCSRIAGDYYASIVQVRAEGRTPTDAEREGAVEIAEEYVENRDAKGDRNAFVSEVKETRDGVDVKLSTTQMGRAVAQRVRRRFGGTITDSRTLVTEDSDGNEVYRVTYAVRLPPYPAGTVIEPEDDDPVLVRSAHGNLKGDYLTTGAHYEADSEDGVAPEARRLGSVDDARETTLVAVEDERAVQVLDPDTFETKTIARPSYLDPGAETVHVLKSRAGLHVLPEDAVEG
ncbi:60S ribosomal export protein NMD3 [Halomarina pelagica]|uniref:60S ribosomal export protein NMD3 n=1 Tax=Halomarina pelagica TaxID=2961599 RepID=UPI0020C23C8C|nr:60S ribosomal export protein NMD3 [Halomarina sp. BND7]